MPKYQNRWINALYEMRYALLVVLIYIVGYTSIIVFLYIPSEIKSYKEFNKAHIYEEGIHVTRTCVAI